MGRRMKINFREASTKRAIVMTITGCITLYNIIFGSGASDMDALIHRVEFWLGTGLTIVGMFGFLPDQPARDPQDRTRETDTPKEVYIPQISLVGRSDPVTENSPETPPPVAFDGSVDESLARMYRAQLLARRAAKTSEQSVRSDGGGYNG